MQNPANPVLEGLGQAVQMASLIQSMKRQNDYMEMVKRRQGEEEQYRQADLAMKLHQIGARPVTPADELESQLGVSINPAGKLMQESTGVKGDFPVLTPSDIKGRTFKLNGQSYVLPSRGEEMARDNEAHAAALRRKIDETKALADVKSQADVAAAKSKLDQMGIPISDEASKLLKLTPGSRILPEHLDDLTRSLGSAVAAQESRKKKLMHAWLTGDASQQVVAMVDTDGNITTTPLPSIGPKPTAKPSARPPSPARTRADAEKQLIRTIAGNAMTSSGGDVNKAIEMLKANAPNNEFIRKNYTQIVPEIKRAAAPKKRIQDMTPDELTALAGSGGSAAAAGDGLAPLSAEGSAYLDKLRKK